MNDEKDRILKLLEEKKITAEEAARLLDAVKGGVRGDRRNRFLKVRVIDTGLRGGEGQRHAADGLVKFGMNFVPDSAKAKFEDQEIDMRVVSEALEKGITGKIVDVDDEEKGQHVEIWLE